MGNFEGLFCFKVACEPILNRPPIVSSCGEMQCKFALIIPSTFFNITISIDKIAQYLFVAKSKYLINDGFYLSLLQAQLDSSSKMPQELLDFFSYFTAAMSHAFESISAAQATWHPNKDQQTARANASFLVFKSVYLQFEMMLLAVWDRTACYS